jgi:hypothetical protein
MKFFFSRHSFEFLSILAKSVHERDKFCVYAICGSSLVSMHLHLIAQQSVASATLGGVILT